MIQLTNCVDYFKRTILSELSDICIVWVAGGCVRDYFSVGQLTSDIDLFFPDVESFEKAKKYLITDKTRKIKEKDGETDVVKIIPKKKAFIVFENDNTCRVNYKGRLFDLVKKYFPSPELCIQEFDFTVSCAAVDAGKVYTHETFFIDLAKRQLMINKLPFPLSTMWRLQKYIKKGYTICSAEMMKIGKAVGALQLNTEEGEKAAIEIAPLSDGGPNFTTFD